MGKYLLSRVFLHALFFFVAGVAAAASVFMIGVPAVGDNPGAFSVAPPFFFGVYFLLLFVEFFWRFRSKLFNQATWKSALSIAMVLGILFGEGFSSLFAMCIATLIEFYSVAHVNAEAHLTAVAAVFLLLFLAFDALGGVVLYQISGAKKAPASEEPSA
jgi:hypothetical protein